MLLHNMTVTKYFTHNPWQAVLRDNLQRKVAFTTTRWVFTKQSVFICFSLYFLLTAKTCYNVSSEADKAQTCALKSLMESHTFIVYIKPWPSIIHSICVYEYFKLKGHFVRSTFAWRSASVLHCISLMSSCTGVSNKVASECSLLASVACKTLRTWFTHIVSLRLWAVQKLITEPHSHTFLTFFLITMNRGVFLVSPAYIILLR